MPWLNDVEPEHAVARRIHLAFKNALLRRLPAEELSKPLQSLSSKYSTSPRLMSRTLLSFRARDHNGDDALLFSYADLLLRLRLTDTDSLLLALLQTSHFVKQAITDDLIDKPPSGLPTCEERMLNLLTQRYMSGESHVTGLQLHGLVYVLTRWMHAVTGYEMNKQLQHSGLSSGDMSSSGMYEALASLILTIFTNPTFRRVSRLSWWKKRRPTIVNEMHNFDSSVLQWTQSQLTGRLQMLATMPPFLETDGQGHPMFSDIQIVQSIQDLPAVNTRAGLYIWLNACLYAKPATDGLEMIMYLQARYAGDMQTLVSDLLTASFDVLTNVLSRQSLDQSVRVVRSFMCNKLPALLAMLSGHMVSASSLEAFVHLALSSITMDVLPPISAGAAEMSENLKSIRLSFLQACLLHDVLSDQTVATILSEPPSPIKARRYAKDALMMKYANNIGSMESLLGELDGMHGNAGAIAGCVVETMHNLCAARDTMNLKVLCSMLTRRVTMADILLQYTTSVQLLSPLCNVLNNWTHDQEQVEYTPAYEEFAAILLFVFAVVHRYGLDTVDVGESNGGSFISKVLHNAQTSVAPEDLTTEQSDQLAKWIEGLYSIDEQGETGGISDEVMRPCPPQAFYLLVPTLFEQSVAACKSSALSTDAFKGGLELLVEPFLLPSLIPGLSWLIRHSWEDHDDADILLQMLGKLLRPSSSSQETRAMHRAILNVVAEPLSASLRAFSQRQPGKTEVTTLLDLLKPQLTQKRTPISDKAEIHSQMSGVGGGVAKWIRDTIDEQIKWVGTVGPTPPPKYGHRLLASSCEAVGADAVLDAIIFELKEQSSRSKGPAALDICTAMVCAPILHASADPMASHSASPQALTGSFSIRDALRLRSSDLPKLLQKPGGEAESLIRLSRRVDAQLATTQLPQMHLPLPLQAEAADQIMADLGLTDDDPSTMARNVAIHPNASAGFNNADFAAVLDQPMDLSDPVVQNLASLPTDTNMIPSDSAQDMFDNINMEIPQSLSQLPNPNGHDNMTEENAEDDIFAGLMTNLDDDFGLT